MSIDPTAFVPEIPGSEPVGLPADGSYLGSAEPEPHATPITPTQEFVERAHPLTPLAKGWIIFVAVLFAVGREFLPGGEVWETDEQGESVVHLLSQAWMWALLGLLGVILVAVAAGWWSWRHTLFTVSDKELRVESGKFFHTSKRVAYNQVQSIDVVQPLAARILGLAEVRVDAGSSEAVKLEFLKKEKAREMREYLLWRAGKTTLTAGARELAESAGADLSGVVGGYDLDPTRHPAGDVYDPTRHSARDVYDPTRHSARESQNLTGDVASVYGGDPASARGMTGGVAGAPQDLSGDGASVYGGDPATARGMTSGVAGAPQNLTGDVASVYGGDPATARGMTGGEVLYPVGGEALRPPMPGGAPTAEQVLIKIPPKELVISVFASLEMLLVLVGLVPPYVIYALIVGPWNMLPALVPALLAVGAVYVRGIGKQWNYQLLKSPSGLRISRGLTQLSSYSIPAKRIQAIEISQPLIWRVLGIYKVRAGIIGSGGEKAEDAEGHVLLPVGSWDEVVMLLRELWPHAWFGDVQLQHVSRSARWFHPFARPFMGWGYNSMFFVVKHGWWFRKYCIVPHSKVQAYQLRRGPFDRRLNTAKLGSKTPEHEVEPSISGIPIADAQRAFADLSGLLMHNEGKLI